ncbi:MAG: CBS domain-containing protein [Candidatus Azotimanducaceae bacterium WSBS_2022_MAG_OTU7]
MGSSISLESYMVKRPVKVNKPNDDIISVATSMLNDKHRRRPVIDDNKLIGQVTCRQILGAINGFTVPKNSKKEASFGNPTQGRTFRSLQIRGRLL